MDVQTQNVTKEKAGHLHGFRSGTAEGFAIPQADPNAIRIATQPGMKRQDLCRNML